MRLLTGIKLYRPLDLGGRGQGNFTWVLLSTIHPSSSLFNIVYSSILLWGKVRVNSHGKQHRSRATRVYGPKVDDFKAFNWVPCICICCYNGDDGEGFTH